MLASFTVVPFGVGESVKEHIAAVVDLIDASGLEYRLGAMQTTIEGEQGEVMDLVMRCHNLIKKRAPRVLTSISIDDRTGAVDRLQGKVQEVEEVLGRTVGRE
jgi:uncharacterized protein (TIGR00106 family)